MQNEIQLEWAKISDARKIVPASRSTFYNWIAAGQIRSRRVNGTRYIDVASLRQLFAGAPLSPAADEQHEMQRRAALSVARRREKHGAGE
jgi:helix-turn-helix protein